MMNPNLVPFFQKGFAKTSSLLLGRAFSELWFDRESSFSPESGWPDSTKTLFLFATHSSWWDPVAAAFLSVELMGRRTIAPMEENEFKKYRSLKYVGIFGVKPGDGPQVEKVIEEEFLAYPGTCVWITPQAKFCPNEREQPLFKTGLSRWSLSCDSLRLPVSIHYHFAHLPRPFIFYRMGKPVEKLSDNIKVDSENLRKSLDENTRALMGRIYEGHLQSNYTDNFTRLNS